MMVTPAMHEWCKRLAGAPEPAAQVPTALQARRSPGRRMLEQLEAAGLVGWDPKRCDDGRAQGDQWTIALTEDGKPSLVARCSTSRSQLRVKRIASQVRT